MFATIRKYSIKPQFMSEVIQRIQGEFLHIISREPGFTVSYALQVGNNEMLMISVFATQAEAEGSTPLAFELVKQNLEGLIQEGPETTVGWIFGSSFGPVVTKSYPNPITLKNTQADCLHLLYKPTE